MMTASWEKLYLSQAPKLLGLCRRYVQDVALAEDLLHDAFLAAIKKQDTYNGSGPVEAWLRKITLNTVLVYLRQEKQLFAASSTTFPEEANEWFDDSPTSVQEQLLGMGFGMSELLEILDQLPEHHRVVFNLYVLEDFGHKQIAEMLGITINTSKSHLARARKKIQELLVEKVNAMKKKDRRAAILFFPKLEENIHPVDELYQKSFADFQIEPTPQWQNKLSDTLDTSAVYSAVSGGIGTVKWIGGVIGVTVLVVGIGWWLASVSPQAQPSPSQPIGNTDSRPIPDSITAAFPAFLPPPATLAGAPDTQTPKARHPQPHKATPTTEPPVIIRKSVVQKDTVYQFQNDTTKHE